MRKGDKGSELQNWNTNNILEDLYKTVWEIKQRVVLDMAADRGKYIDQSQSLTLESRVQEWAVGVDFSHELLEI